MKRLRGLTFLMAITLIIITGFQVYWLKDNYDRENKTMQIKTRVAFEETIEQLQAKKLKLPAVFMRTSPAKNDVIIEKKTTNIKSRKPVPVRHIIETANVTYTLKDSAIRKDSNFSQPVFIVLKDTNGFIKRIPMNAHFDSLRKQAVLNNVDRELNMPDDRRQIVTTINILRSKLRDSLKIDTGIHTSFFLRMPRDSSKLRKRTVPVSTRKYTDTGKNSFRIVTDTNNQALRVLYTVDSLQDSLQLPEIIKGFSATLKKQNLAIPFTITRPANAAALSGEHFTDITVGFAHPITYRLLLGNTFPYLIKRISWPILFSLFLVAVTIFSFVLLYRNLLRQQRLAEIKNDFISNITHELKTPIATVGVAIEALKSFNAMHDPKKTKEYLDISANELQRLSLLVDKVLKLSMFEKKEVDLNKENFDMKGLTQEVLDTMRLQFEKNNAVINFVTDGNDFAVNADKLHITSVIYNLLDNALKYRNGDPLINVTLSSDANNIELKVADNGIGIANEYQGRIFDKFFRVPTGNKHVVKGYGLGLSYVSHIIAQHKGSIHVQSELDKGSTFTIKLPKNAES